MFKFIKTKNIENPNDIIDIELTITYNDLTIPELLEAFEQFLRASGYYFEGSVVIEEKL